MLYSNKVRKIFRVILWGMVDSMSTFTWVKEVRVPQKQKKINTQKGSFVASL